MKNNNQEDIIEFLSNYSLESILSATIEMQMLQYGHKDLVIPVSEYLATNALYACDIQGKKTFEWADYLLLESMGNNIFSPNIDELFSEAISLMDKSDDVKRNFLQSQTMHLKGLTFRGDGYLHQLIDVAKKLYEPLNAEFVNTLEFKYSSFEEVVKYIFAEYGKRIAIAYKDKYKITNMIKALMKNKRPYLPSIKSGYIFRIEKKDLKKIVNEDEIEAIFSYLGILPNEGPFSQVNPEDFKILISKPFIDFGNYIYMPLIFSTLMNLPKLFHYSFVAEKLFDKKSLEKYKKNRGDVIEDISRSCFERITLKSNIYTSLNYTNEDGQADVTVVEEFSTLFCECKSKLITLNSFKGIHSDIKTDVKYAIGDAYDQGVRSIKRVVSGKEFNTDDGGMIVIKNNKERFVICITGENFGIIPSEIEKYIEIDPVAGVPYVVNIYDLDIITQECNSYGEFLEYLRFRRENHSVIAAIDELDVFGFFKVNGNIEIILDGDQLHITDFTRDFDKKYKLKDKEILKKIINTNKTKTCKHKS